MDVTRRGFVASVLAWLVWPGLGAAGAAAEGSGPDPGRDPEMDAAQGPQTGAALEFEPLDVEESAWKPLLTPKAYAVLFEEDTEPPGSSPLLGEKHAGHYVCAACFLPLFRSETKYDSGTGWPSFFDAIDGRLGKKRDFRLLLPRTEYHCARCGGHQGHVFGDGPEPTGLRYCNNGLALRFVPEGEPLPALREPS